MTRVYCLSRLLAASPSWRTCPNSCAASDWMSKALASGRIDHCTRVEKRTSDSAGPSLLYQVTVQAIVLGAEQPGMAVTPTPQSTLLIPSCARPDVVRPS